MSALDDAMTAAGKAETLYNSDLASITTIQSQIATATAPLAPAQTQLVTDATAYNAALDAVSAAAQAAKVPVPPTPTTGS